MLEYVRKNLCDKLKQEHLFNNIIQTYFYLDPNYIGNMTNGLEINIQELDTSNRSWYNHQFNMEMDGATLTKEQKGCFPRYQ